PSGKYGAVVLTQGAESDIWIYDFIHKNYIRFTFGGSNYTPVWSPDEKSVYYVKNLGEPGTNDGTAWGVWKKPTDGSRAAELITKLEWRSDLNDISPDGKYLYFSSNAPTGNAIYRLATDKDSRPELLVKVHGNAYCAALSPDGQWIAYTSTESGR